MHLPMKKVIDFLRSSYHELSVNVSWPKYESLQKSAVIVLVASLLIAGFVGGVDLVFEKIMRWYYRSF